MRIYYPINKEEPTPALPKGGSLNEAQYSLTTNRLTSNRRYPPSLGVIDEVASLVEERLRVGELCSGNRRSRFACRRMGLGVGFHSPSSLEVAPQGIADLKSSYSAQADNISA